jgi:isoquinoline 1-oxidoreductase subunit beta
MIKAMRYLVPKPSPQDGFSRRRFLKVLSLGTAGFVIGCTQTAPPPTPQATAFPVTTGTPNASSSPEASAEASSEEFNAFIRVSSDDTVTVIIKHAEFGQGVTTGLTTIVAEEMDARWDQMKWEFAPANLLVYKNLSIGIQGTGGSSSIANSWNQLREAGAGAKAMLVAAAAAEWNVPTEEVEVSEGRVAHKSGKEATFGALAAAAAKQKPPAELKLKEPKDFKLIGKDLVRLDAKQKSDGTATFTIDVEKPGMLIAVVAHPPKFGGKVQSFKAEGAMAVEGVKEVVEIPSGIAVVANSFWSASQGRKALEIEWDLSQAEQRGTDELFADFRKLAEKPGAVARDTGDALAAQKSADKLIETTYEFPFLAHASMEPMGCVIELIDDGAILTHCSQIQTLDQANVARALGLSGPDKVQIDSVFGGGSFGRRATTTSDYVVECAQIVKALKEKAPVKLTRDRTDDLRAGYYRPMSYHVVKGTVDANGKPESSFQRIVIQSFMKGTPFEGMIRDGIDAAAVEGSANLPYAIPNQRVEAHIADVKIPTLWWRSVGHTQNAFVTETFFDRLCVEGGTDSVKMRQEMLKDHPRHLGVLNLAVEKAGPPPTAKGSGRGVAVHESFDSFVAEVVDVHLEKQKIKIDRVVCAVDCGLAVNPDIVKAQMESGIMFGLSAALREQIVLKDGKVRQANFDSYPVARLPDTPIIEVYIVPSAEPPTGVGEPGLPPLAPALANAIYRATGKWITKLPLTLEGLA